jgi:ATP diphosphatase
METLLDGLLHPRLGCPWDLTQTPESISEDVLEETYELREALLTGDPLKIKEEAGDLTFLLFFMGRLLLSSSKGFGLTEILDFATDKMVKRHPHVFKSEAQSKTETKAETKDETKAETKVPGPDKSPDKSLAEGSREASSPDQTSSSPGQTSSSPDQTSPTTPEEVLVNWHAIKRKEKKNEGLLESVPVSLPALARCQRLGAKASKAGFDWKDAYEVREKVSEELHELDYELQRGDLKDPEILQRIGEELGDLLSSLSNLARHLGLSAEKCLQDHNARFAERVGRMEKALKDEGRTFEESSPLELEELWRLSKRSL